MKNIELNQNLSWNGFLDRCEHAEKLVLFGASSCADVFLNKIVTRREIAYIVDNDPKKQGNKFDGTYDIYSPDVLKEESFRTILLITSTFYDEIVAQLEKLEFQGEVYSFLHLRNKAANLQDIEDLRRNMKQLKEILYDNRSKEIIQSIYEKKRDGITDFSNIYENNQYFPFDIFSFLDEEVFIDGGAYDGQTVKDFIKVVNGKFKKVYSFEMDKTNYDKIVQMDFGQNVIFKNCGLWDKKEQYSYIANERGSEIVADGNNLAECVTLDDMVQEKVTFIKMDIEGAEQKAILGATHIIKRDTPKLAICLYHKTEDLWKIPLMVHDMVPAYKLFIRHHGKNNEETVLYAKI